MKKILVIIFIAIFTNYHLSASGLGNIEADEDSVAEISFSVVGDLMCHSTQFKWAETDSNSFDFRHNYEFIKQYLETADVTIGNLETVVDTKSDEYEGYPVFNTPEEYLEALKYAGFDLLATANNHSTDGRKKGVIETIKAIKNNGMDYTGTFLDKQDRDSLRVYNHSGLSYTVLSYTYGLNIYNLRSPDKFMVNLIDTAVIKQDIRNHRLSGTDLIIVFLHAGSENAKEPTQYQIEVVNKLIEFGADIIVSSSPHVLQPIDVKESIKGNIDSVLVSYSLGNFISNQRWRYSDGGVILNFSVEKNCETGQLKLSNVSYLPVWVFKGWTKEGRKYHLLPSEVFENKTDYPFLSEDDRAKMKVFNSDAIKILGKYSSGPKLLRIQKDEVLVRDSVKIIRN